MKFVIHEAHLISKVSNAVISFLHYFFKTNTDLYCDNCSGQNKNSFLVWYCL